MPTGIVPHSGPRPFDLERVRADFPILTRLVRGKRLVYLDTAASAQKPARVLDAVDRFYREHNANVHRGVYTLSEEATRLYEGARVRVQRFLGARDPREIVFLRGTTEALNLAAFCLSTRWKPDDEIVVSALEHHSNLVPWQLAAERTGARIRVIPLNADHSLDLDAFDRLLNERTQVVAVSHVSNALGCVAPLREISERAHAVGALVVVDGAQAAPHLPIRVAELGCDMYAFSGHKCYGPTGIGVLYGRLELMQSLPPYQGGGEMIRSVSFERSTYADPPHRFEAGTPDISGAVGLGEAIDYLESWDRDSARAYERALLEYAIERLSTVDGVRVLAGGEEPAAVLSCVLKGIHPHDAATILDQDGIAVRAGHHCAQPLMELLGVPATLRMSLGLYSGRDDVDAFVVGLRKVREWLG